MRPQGVSRSTSHCSGGTQSSGVRFWNLTASAPARHAPSTSRRAVSRQPLWLMPISATTNTGSPSPTKRPPMRTLALLIAPPPLSFTRLPTQRQDPLRELAESTEAAGGRAAVVHGGEDVRGRVRGGAREPGPSHLDDELEVVDVVPDEGQLAGLEPRLRQHPGQAGPLVRDALEQEGQAQLLRAPGHHRGAFAGDDGGGDARGAQALDAHAVLDREPLQGLAVR